MTKETKFILKELLENIHHMEKRVNELMARELGIQSEMEIIDNPEERTIITTSFKLPVEIKREEVEEVITKQMRELGIAANLLGYQYIREAVMLILQDKSYLKQISKSLYPDIAKYFGTSSSRVERAIRHAIEVICQRGNLEKINQMFSHTVAIRKGKPSNTEFLSTFAEDVEKEMKKKH